MSEEPSSWTYEPNGSVETKSVVGGLAIDAATDTADAVEWVAAEYITHTKPPLWYAAFTGVSLVVIVATYLLSKNILAAIVLLIVCGSIVLFAVRPPRDVKYRLAGDGVHIGQKFFPIGSFKSFAVLNEDGTPCIWLRPLKRFMPTVNMYYSPQDEDKIITVLAQLLPEEERTHDIMDRFSRKIRF